LAGNVAFPAPGGHGTQALLGEVANLSTVSLINASLNQTDATTVTTALGAFKLTFAKTFRPSATDSYYLEAVKGLKSNLPGNNAARLRTLVRFHGGWQSLTNATPGAGSINLDFGTTAIAIAAALRHNSLIPVDFAALMGTYDGSVFAPAGGVTAPDFTALSTLTQGILTQNGDPIAGVTLVGANAWIPTNTVSSLTIASISPASASVGATVSIVGAGFAATPASNSVLFSGGKTGTVGLLGPNQLVVTVPYGAISGPVWLSVGSLTASTPSFWVSGALSGGIGTNSATVTSGQITN
jgi:hypothetical protein